MAEGRFEPNPDLPALYVVEVPDIVDGDDGPRHVGRFAIDEAIRMAETTRIGSLSSTSPEFRELLLEATVYNLRWSVGYP